MGQQYIQMSNRHINTNVSFLSGSSPGLKLVFSLSFSQKSCSGSNGIRAAYRPLQQGMRSMSDHQEPRSLKRSPVEWVEGIQHVYRGRLKCPPHPGHRQKNVAGCCGSPTTSSPTSSSGRDVPAQRGGSALDSAWRGKTHFSNPIPFLRSRAPGAVT